MMRYTIKRLLLAIPTLLAMLTAVFVLVRLVPGDPAAAMLGDQASASALAALRTQLGLNLPLHTQYLNFLGDALRGNFGYSLSNGQSVLREVAEVLPWTLQLTFASIVIGIGLGLPLGIWAALRRDAWPDYVSRLFSLAGLSFPAFVSGILMLLVFAIELNWFPVIGSTTSGNPWSQWRGLVLPAFNLGLIMMAYVTRVARSSMLSVLSEDYIRTARAKGAGEWQVLWRHAMPNALVPVLTILGMQFSFLLAGGVIIENVFFLPGLGRLVFQAIVQRDLIVVQSVVVILVIAVMLVTFAVDLSYTLVNPRLRAADGS